MNLRLILRWINCLCDVEIGKPVIEVSPVAPPERQDNLVLDHFVTGDPEKRLIGLSDLSDHLQIVVSLTGFSTVPVL